MKHNQSVQELENGIVRVKGKCVFTREEYQCEVPADGLQRWLAGEPIQTAMPGVSPDIREFLISGISPKGWSKSFGGEGDE